MNELTIKQKAEAYDKAIEQLRDFYRDYDIVSGLIDVKEELANIFPEIKESKYERIRQRIIHALHGDVLEMSETKEAIAWLEKQGNKKDNLSVDFVLGCLGIKPAYKDGNAWCILLGNNIQEGICGFGGTKEEALIAFMKDLIENQGEKKPFDYENANMQQNDFAPKSALEAIKEEKVDNQNCVKPIDEVEPKFKVRDWITNGELLVGQVSSFDGEYYHYICDGIEQPLHISNAYKWHLWTIADAKDGDVLAADGYIILFKKRLPKDGGVSYCHYDYACTNPQFNFNEDDNWLFNEKSEVVHPATEEQIKLLFAKMKEAGYEWDAKKKELKKIDSKPNFDVEIPFGTKDSELEEVFYSIPNGFHAEIEDDKVVIKKGEKKPACSNEHYELEEFAKIVRCNLTGISKAVQKLFEAKYRQLTGNEMYGGLKD